MVKIDYPVEPHNIVVLGKPDDFIRSFIIRPLRQGAFSLIVAPQDIMSTNHYLRFDMEFRDLRGAPKRIIVEIPKKLQKQFRWEWKLIRWPDHLQQLMIQSLNGEETESEVIKSESKFENKDISTTELFYLHHEAAEGSFKLEEARLESKQKILMWSCNQPFTTSEGGSLVLEETSKLTLKWYQRQVEAFDPNQVWVLGDAAYSDGTEASNFIDEYYNQTGWATDPKQVKELKYNYRDMYRGHWSFQSLQNVMRNYPHVCVWDDHEIRDGWGSEKADFEKHNATIYKVARGVAEEYLLNNGPRVRDPKVEPASDAHQAYFSHNVAAFIFDGRSSRRYHGQQGHVISPQQFKDFERFCDATAENPEIRFLIMGCGVPFINLKDFVEELGSKAPKALTDMISGIRDDVRDSWHSPGNREALKELIKVLRRLHHRRGDIEIINISGDIHVANAFTFQPLGFRKTMYQITSSALTNRQHMPEMASELLSVGTEAFSDTLGLITRVWTEVTDPNLMLISNHNEYLRFELKVFDLENPSNSLNSKKDKILDVGAHSLTLGYVL